MRHFFSLLAALLFISACSDAQKDKREQPAPLVVTAKVIKKDMPVILQAVGRAEASESVSLKSRVDGQISQVLFNEGQKVKANKALVSLDTADFAARLNQAAANAERDKALANKTAADVLRYTQLREKNFVSEEKVNEIRTNAKAAEANYKASSAAAQLARLQHNYSTIKAPFDGVLGAKNISPGMSVRANDTTLVVINRIKPLMVSFTFPERYLPRLQTAMQNATNADQKTLLTVDLTIAESAEIIQGKVTFIDNAVNANNGTILLKARIDNENEALKSGQFLNVSLVLETLKEVITVPNDAIAQSDSGNYVFVVSAENKAEMRKVRVLSQLNGFSAVEGKLEAEEKVVIDGHLRIRPNETVREAAEKSAEKSAEKGGEKENKKEGKQATK